MVQKSWPHLDVPALLLAARQQAGLSQSGLAAAAGTGRGALSDYERGRRSPSAATLGRLLAAAGLQLRVSLEPLLAHVDARVDAMLEGAVDLPLETLSWIATSLEETRRWRDLDADEPADDPDDEPDDDPMWCSGSPHWAFDGATALNLHGLATPLHEPAVVVVWEPAAQAWLSRELLQALAHPVGWWSVDLEEARWAAARGLIGRRGHLVVRFETELPPVVHLQPAGADHVVPVVTVDEVEQSFPAYGEVLARWRERRAGAAGGPIRRTVWG